MKSKPRGKPFTKNDPRSSKGRGAGRPKKTVTWKKAEVDLRQAFPRLLLMTSVELKNLLSKNPKVFEMVAAKYIEDYPTATVDRFLSKIPNILTGEGGQPLIPEQKAPVLPPIDFSKWSPKQIDRFIENTKSK